MSRDINHACALLKAGELVVIPTETVYGLAGNARDPRAIAKIFALKQRPANNPLIVHIHDITELANWAIDIPVLAYRLAEAFWPGPLTLVLKKQANVSKLITGDQETIAIRMPKHPQTQALLQAFKGAVCAPSANRFMTLSPTRPAHVRASFGDACPFILPGDVCDVGIESTILDLSQEPAQLLRPGMISQAELEILLPLQTNNTTTRAPGQYKAHYQPQTPVKLVASSDLRAVLSQLQAAQQSYFALALTTLVKDTNNIIHMPTKAQAYAQCLYDQLFKLDNQRNIIVIEMPPKDSGWSGIHDRLQKMAHQ